MSTTPSNHRPAAPSEMESAELLAVLLLRAHTHERRGLGRRCAVLTAAADLNGDPAAVLRYLREAPARS